MKLARLFPSSRRQGYALMLTVMFTGIGAIILAGAMRWTSNSALQTERNNEYWQAAYAAEAATEKVLAEIVADHREGGEANVYSQMSSYASDVPNASEDPLWADFDFNNAQGTSGQTYIQRLAAVTHMKLDNRYEGLRGFVAPYRIVSNAKNLKTPFQVEAGMGQIIQVGTIPLFQFAIFYSIDLEIHPGATMVVTGPVHSNADIYTRPPSSLTFASDVTAAGNIITDGKAGDPNGRSGNSIGNIKFNAEHDSQVSSLNLPIGTTNSPDEVYKVLGIPPTGESPNSPLGKERYHNKADIILIVSNNTVTAKSGVHVNNSATAIPTNEWSKFLNTNVTFFNKRENLPIQTSEIDVDALRKWSATNNLMRPLLGNRDVSSVYIADMRTTSTTTYTTNKAYTTNYVYITNTIPTNSFAYPADGTYAGPINLTSLPTNSTAAPSIPPALNVVTNTTVTTTPNATPPAVGSYVGTLTTNTLSTNSATYPTAGSYIGSVTTNIVTTNTVAFPGSGTYVGVVTTNTVITNTVSFPTAGTYVGVVTTNVVSTNTTGYPAAGSFIPPVTTNTTQVNNASSYPAAGTFIPPVTTNIVSGKKRYTYSRISGYAYAKVVGYRYAKVNGYQYSKISGYQYAKVASFTYNKITGYSYDLPGYQYSKITGLTTNMTVSTNTYVTTTVIDNAEPGVRLKNGRTLPTRGLTVSSPNPLYILGDYNTSIDGVNFHTGTTNTANTRPASVVGDAITILSTNWKDSNSWSSVSSRTAASTTVNTAILGGIVTTKASDNTYSGGVENFPRFLENWSGKDLTYNGSMVVMFESKQAKAPWGGGDVYSPPNRKWAFDVNFMDPIKLPPGTPQIPVINRQTWTFLPPGTVSF